MNSVKKFEEEENIDVRIIEESNNDSRSHFLGDIYIYLHANPGHAEYNLSVSLIKKTRIERNGQLLREEEEIDIPRKNNEGEFTFSESFRFPFEFKLIEHDFFSFRGTVPFNDEPVPINIEVKFFFRLVIRRDGLIIKSPIEKEIIIPVNVDERNDRIEILDMYNQPIFAMMPMIEERGYNFIDEAQFMVEGNQAFKFELYREIKIFSNTGTNHLISKMLIKNFRYDPEALLQERTLQIEDNNMILPTCSSDFIRCRYYIKLSEIRAPQSCLSKFFSCILPCWSFNQPYEPMKEIFLRKEQKNWLVINDVPGPKIHQHTVHRKNYFF